MWSALESLSKLGITWPWARLPALVIGVAALFLCQCGPRGNPELIQVLKVAPSMVGTGDRLQIYGAGFPAGRRATVVLRGKHYRPGRSPERMEVVTQGYASSASEVDLTVDPALVVALCGKGTGAHHATFRGTVGVEFGAREPGALRIRGTLNKAVLDCEPEAVSRAVLLEREARAKRWLAYFGIELGFGEKTFTVARVGPGSPAERAGVLAGDVLTDLDGVRLLHGSDFAPSAPRWALLTLERGPLQKSNTLRVEVDGFHREPNADLLVGSILVGVMIALILMMIAPVSRVLTWGERQVARRLSELSPEARASREGAYRIPSEDSDPWMARLLVSIAVGSALAAMAFGQPLVDVDLDLLVLWFSACVALISVSFLSGLVRRDGRWTLLGGLRRGGWVFLSQLPAAIATSCVATVAHGFSAQELVAAQGAAPWRWFAFHAPASPLLWLLFCASWMPDYVSHPGKHLARVLVAVEWGYLAVMGAVAATLFFGGWRLPFSTETTETTALKALGALVFILKAWGVSSAMLYARALLPRLQPGALLPVFFRWLGPIALVVMVITWASERWVHVGWVRSASEISGYIGVALALLVALAFARRVLLNLRSATSSQVRLSPWL